MMYSSTKRPINRYNSCRPSFDIAKSGTKLVVEWFLKNLTDVDVWESAYYNAFTGDLFFEGRSIGFVGLDSVFDEYLAEI